MKRSLTNHSVGPVYTECQRQCCDVAGSISLIKLLRFLNKLSQLLQKWVVTTIDNKHWCSRSKSSLTLGVNGSLDMFACCHVCLSCRVCHAHRVHKEKSSQNYSAIHKANGGVIPQLRLVQFLWNGKNPSANKWGNGFWRLFLSEEAEDSLALWKAL